MIKWAVFKHITGFKWKNLVSWSVCYYRLLDWNNCWIWSQLDLVVQVGVLNLLKNLIKWIGSIHRDIWINRSVHCIINLPNTCCRKYILYQKIGSCLKNVKYFFPDVSAKCQELTGVIRSVWRVDSIKKNMKSFTDNWNFFL